MYVKDTIRAALERQAKTKNADEAERAQRWIERVTILLDWIRQHPNLIEIHNEATALLQVYRGEAEPEQPSSDGHGKTAENAK